jgi:hypothetical protein
MPPPRHSARHGKRPFWFARRLGQEMPSMLLQIPRANADRANAIPSSFSCPLDWIGPVEDEEHILVLGGHGPELMCALLRAGAPNVTHLRPHERPEAGSASLVIVPRIPSLDWLAVALPWVRRGLTANGSVVIQAGDQPTTRSEVRRMLKVHGFIAIRAGGPPDRQAVSAKIPAKILRQSV